MNCVYISVCGCAYLTAMSRLWARCSTFQGVHCQSAGFQMNVTQYICVYTCVCGCAGVAAVCHLSVRYPTFQRERERERERERGASPVSRLPGTFMYSTRTTSKCRPELSCAYILSPFWSHSIPFYKEWESTQNVTANIWGAENVFYPFRECLLCEGGCFGYRTCIP